MSTSWWNFETKCRFIPDQSFCHINVQLFFRICVPGCGGNATLCFQTGNQVLDFYSMDPVSFFLTTSPTSGEAAAFSRWPLLPWLIGLLIKDKNSFKVLQWAHAFISDPIDDFVKGGRGVARGVLRVVWRAMWPWNGHTRAKPEPARGSGGMLPRKFWKFRLKITHFPAFSAWNFAGRARPYIFSPLPYQYKLERWVPNPTSGPAILVKLRFPTPALTVTMQYFSNAPTLAGRMPVTPTVACTLPNPFDCVIFAVFIKVHQ